MSKEETRTLAHKYGLSVANKPESQDICFVPNGRYGDVVRRLRPGAVEPGEIVHLDGTVLGMHNGVIDYTIGQRRGADRWYSQSRRYACPAQCHQDAQSRLAQLRPAATGALHHRNGH